MFDFDKKSREYRRTIETLERCEDITKFNEWVKRHYVHKYLKQEIEIIKRGDYIYSHGVFGEFSSGMMRVGALEHHYSKSKWHRNFFKLLISNSLRTDKERLMDMGCVLLRLAWNLSSDHQMELHENENGDIPEMMYKEGKMLDILSNVLTELSHGIPASRGYVPFKPTCSEWYFVKGKKILQTKTILSSYECLLQIEICKRCFKAAMNEEFGSNELIIKTSNLYLSALYYVTGKYEEAWNYFVAALSRHTGDHRDSQTVENKPNVCVSSGRMVSIPLEKMFSHYKRFFLQQELWYGIQHNIINLPSEWIAKFSTLGFKIRSPPPDCNSTIDLNLHLSSRDTLAEMLTKLSIQHLCKFDKFSDTTKGPSHFLVPWLYRQKRPRDLVSWCDNYDCLLNREDEENLCPVSVILAFQNLFPDDVTFLIGLMTLISDGGLLNFEGDKNQARTDYFHSYGFNSLTRDEILRIVRTSVNPKFMIWYLKFKSLIELNYHESSPSIMTVFGKLNQSCCRHMILETAVGLLVKLAFYRKLKLQKNL